jgi:glutathione S-transferase
MAGLQYRTDSSGFRKAPKGKLPYIEDGGVIIADSTFIRMHLECAHGVDFDAGLTSEQRAIEWAFEKMLEDHLYWALIHARWIIDENFAAGPSRFFAAVPAPLRPLVHAMVRREVRRNLKGHGIGRHSDDDICRLAVRDLQALADFLGDKPFLMGEKPCGADATAFAFVAGTLTPCFKTPIRVSAELQPNLVAYRDRMLARYYPQFAQVGHKAA